MFELAACIGAWLPILGVTHLVHRGDSLPRIPGRRFRALGRVVARLSPLWELGVVGEPPADIDTRAYVVVANHESNADPFLLSHLPWDMRWVAKEELFKTPAVGWLLRLAGDIPLRRGDGESVREMFATCRETLAGGLSVMLFPEGTRSKDGQLRAFKDGAFELAIEAQAPVLPIVVSGTRECIQKGSFMLGEARATARILAPIETAGLTLADVAKLRDTVRARIADAIALTDAPSSPAA